MSDIKSRTDAYLAYAMRETDTYPAPQSRLDEMLIELAETVRLGGASPDVIRQAVNDYLAANPPAGMTDEQIADSVNDSIANGDIQVGTVLTTDQINNINDIPTLAEEISDNKITGASIVNDELVISLGDGSSINAGDVVSDPYVPVVGTVVSVPSTEPAKVTIVNDADTNESTFNFEIPKGDDGSSPTMTQVTDENVLTHALTYDPLTSNEFYAFDCSGLPNTMRYGYCRVNVSQDPLYRDITFKCPTSGRIYVNTIGADPDDPTVLGSWSGWHVSLLEEDVKEYTEADILEMLNLSEVELDILSNLIDDDNISLSKTFSSSKIFQGLQEMLEEGKRFTLSAIATKIGSSYKVVNSISQMIDTNYIYLLGTSTGYDMYIVDDGGRAVQIGDTQIDLSDYYNKTQVDDKFVTKADADGKYATISTVEGKVEKDKIATVLDDSVTDEQVASAKAVYDKVKDSNIKTYTALEQLGLTSGCTVQEVYIALPTPSTFVAKTINTDITDIPTTRGIIIVHKPIAGFVEVTFKETAIAGVSPNNMWLGSLKGGDGTGLTWSKVCATKVADVNETSIEFDKTALGLTITNNRSKYTVINGICYVTIEFGANGPSESVSYGYKKVNTTTLPKIGFNTKGMLNVLDRNNPISVVLDKDSTDLKLHGIIDSKEGTYTIQGSFSYPVSE